MSDNREVSYELNTTGLMCPEPMMMLHNRVRDMKEGEVVRVVATDPSTQRDIPKFCTFLGHKLLEHRESDNTYIYLIRKAG